MIVGIAKHLIALGTKPSDMVLLSAYSGQLVTVREVMRGEGLELETDTLDNFQVGFSDYRSLHPQCQEFCNFVRAILLILDTY